MDLAALRAENNEIIAHRTRIGFGLGLVGGGAVALAEAIQGGPLPLPVIASHANGLLFALGGMLLFRTATVRRDPVPYVLAVIIAACALRALFGAWRGDTVSTVFLCTVLALAVGGSLPWGLRPQVVVALACAAAIAVNAWLVSGSVLLGSWRDVAGVGAALVLSVVLAYDRERHRRRVFAETLARHRSERQLAELNAALEQRVDQRAAELEAVRREAEAQARQHQAELAHVLRVGTMGEMAAGLAHEINQPIGAIANYALGTVRRLRDGTLRDDDLLPVVEAIGAEALRAGDTIRRVRELLRKETPAVAPVDLNEVARAAVRVAEAEARQRGVAVTVELAPALPPIAGHAIHLEQVLLNLLLNAIDASSGGADPGRVVVRTAASAAGVEVTISDNGTGLPPPPVDVFAPFFTTKPHGLGMGLSISRSIVEAHGGTLDGRSDTPRGSTFRLHLPAEAAGAALRPAAGQA